MPKKVLALIFSFTLCQSFGQESSIPEPVVCHANLNDAFTQILSRQNQGSRRLPTSSIEVTYEDFPNVAETAFEKAVSIWEEILISKIPIRINASWESLEGTTLAFSGASRIFRNVDNVAYNDVWYVGPLAEAISGKDLNNGDFDINVTLNSNMNWSFSTNGTLFPGRFDLITVVLHEIAHGLGFSSSMKLINDDTEGEWGQSGFPYIYDVFVQNGNEIVLTDKATFTNPSSDLRNELISEDLFFKVSNPKYANNLPKIHSPNPFKTGGSISHLDENEYPAGSVHSLMSPSVKPSEAVHDPGELILSMLNEMGWPINNLESFTILAEMPEREAEVLVYPNPSEDEIAIAIPLNQRAMQTSFILTDVNGRVMNQFEKNTIDEPTVYSSTKTLLPGIYILKIMSEKGETVKRIIKR